MPADGTFAACCNDQDFGTSRFSSSLGQNTPLAEIEKGWESKRPTSVSGNAQPYSKTAVPRPGAVRSDLSSAFLCKVKIGIGSADRRQSGTD